MIRIIDGRGSGKSSRLLLIAKETDAYFVCKNPEDMRKKAYEYGITGIHFLSYNEYLCRRYYDGEKKIVIDELETYLNYVNSSQIIAYTISDENKYLHNYDIYEDDCK